MDQRQTAAGVLELSWATAGNSAASDFLRSLTSLLYDGCQSLRLQLTDGDALEDPDPREVARAFQAGSCREVRLSGGVIGGGWAAGLQAADSCSIRIENPVSGGHEHWVWLQALSEIPSALPVLALPTGGDADFPSLCHALVGLASRCGDLVRASWTPGNAAGQQPSAEWNRSASSGPVLVESAEGAIWALAAEDAKAAPPSPPLRFVQHPQTEAPRGIDPHLVEDLKKLVSVTPILWDLIGKRCSQCGESPVAVIPLNFSNPGEFRTPLQADGVLAIRPETDRVVLQVDDSQSEDIAAVALAHGVAHVALGHIRPGDRFGHWDTAETLRNGHRRWDQDVRQSFPEWFQTKGRIKDLKDCSPRDHAMLGLWRMIHETLGESSKLHPRAAKYQSAAYQRQAAERLLSQLDSYRGAMLCDGVGLGKTYIATTVMVHCVNRWAEARADAGATATSADLFRITVLAPNSVVSTWRREAIPPLYAYGVLPASVRVISHSKLSRISSTSEVLVPSGPNGFSDLEHLMLSDLVIVDEAHNFRSSDARRSLVLRDLLRLQPRKETERRVLLLTATPVNNSLDDLRQQTALMFSKPIPLSEASTADAYRRQALEEIRKRAKKSRTPSADKGNVAALMIHGDGKALFSKRIEFRDDLDFGTRVQRIGDYLNEQDKKLKSYQGEIRNNALAGDATNGSSKAIRVADELLDRIVVQRSRNLCKEIERQAGSHTEILFRPDAGLPEKLRYSDEYDGIRDVLAGFLPLFARSADPGEVAPSGVRPLSLRIYMWYDVREGFKEPTESSPVVGLQRALVLKRLESSPVSLLITLLRLTVFHAYRLKQLLGLCTGIQDGEKVRRLRSEIDAVLGSHQPEALDKLRSLATGDSDTGAAKGFIERLARSHQTLRPVADTDDSPAQQLSLDLYGNGDDDEETQLQREQVERLWGLKDAILEDFDTLLRVSPGLADIVFGKFERREWPRRFIAGGLEVDWPGSAAWGQRIVSDAKIRRLFARLLEARRSGQKVIVFSQFSDSLAYIHSVLKACRQFTLRDWSLIVAGLGVADLHADEMRALLAVTEVITGDTEDRDGVVNAFAPYYRIGPFPPTLDGVSAVEANKVLEDWQNAWRQALANPIDVLLATDVLAEGVNLQDVALLINFDVHWNPVRMIQRSGRVDRRLNPRIEHLTDTPEVSAIARGIGKPVPPYYWHGRTGEAPLTVNMILPDEIERELLLRERIAIKTLAIDFTMGLDQGTGAEADWMDSYRFQGISSLNAFQKDRAIEQIAGYHEKLTHEFARRGIDKDWSQTLNVWLRQNDGSGGMPLLARASIGQKGGPVAARLFSRYLEPSLKDGIPCWLWSEEKPRDSLLNQWLVLDAKTFPPRIERGLPWTENASSPISAHHLLVAIRGVVDGSLVIEELPLTEVGRPLQQGITAVAAGYFGDEDSRRNVKVESFFLLQLESFEDRNLSA